MRFHTIELNGREVNFRLTSQDCVKIEEQCKVKLLDYITDYSMTTIINLLYFMRRGAEQGFTKNEAFDLFDELADAEWSLEKIIKEIILPTAMVSGLLKKSDLMKVTEAMDNQATQE